MGSNYEQFTPAERVSLLLAAMARGDDAEAERLGRSCPRRTYDEPDAAYGDRVDVAFDVLAVVCIDLRTLVGKLHTLHWAGRVVRHAATHHGAIATMAFLDGCRHGGDEPQLEFFAGLADEAAEDEEDDEPVDAGDELDDDTTRLSSVFDGELGRRIGGVEDRSRRATDEASAVLVAACNDLAGELATVWDAFGRFCRTRVGVGPKTLLDAWAVPIRQEVVAMLKQYAHVPPDPHKAAEYLGLLCNAWDRRFGEQP